MASFGAGGGRVLYLVVCAAPPATRTPVLVAGLRDAGWDVHVVFTPAAAAWVDVDAIEVACGHPVRSGWRRPEDPAYEPPGDALLVAPATFNSMNKAAAGISDSLALGLVNEAVGRRVPTVMLACVNDGLAAHPAYGPGVAVLRGAGVHVVNVASDDEHLARRAHEALADLSGRDH
jgi:phosphopantothenoylcysteine synthetase/decarboxylase